MITENFWFENEDVEWSLKYVNLLEEPKLTSGSLILKARNTKFGCCMKEDVIEKTIYLENVNSDLVEVQRHIY